MDIDEVPHIIRCCGVFIPEWLLTGEVCVIPLLVPSEWARG